MQYMYTLTYVGNPHRMHKSWITLNERRQHEMYTVIYIVVTSGNTLSQDDQVLRFYKYAFTM